MPGGAFLVIGHFSRMLLDLCGRNRLDRLGLHFGRLRHADHAAAADRRDRGEHHLRHLRWLTGNLPILVLHVVLLPFNLYRRGQLLTTGCAIRRALTADAKLDAIRPMLATITLPDGATLFRKGDRPDNRYILDSGRIQLVEIDSKVKPGEMFGESAFFSEARVRTLTATCEGDCVLLALNERDLTAEFHRNPAFGFAMIKLVSQCVALAADEKGRGNAS
ncbi:MAG: hypothetical protein ACJA1L_001811 [Paracoccaceae bacterium]|jgi:hypothetical protein